MNDVQEEYDELLRYAVVVPSYSNLPSLTTTGATSATDAAASLAVQMMPTQSWATGGVHIVATTEAGASIAAQTVGADVITVCPPVQPTTYVEPSSSSVQGQLFRPKKISLFPVALSQ